MNHTAFWVPSSPPPPSLSLQPYSSQHLFLISVFLYVFGIRLLISSQLCLDSAVLMLAMSSVQWAQEHLLMSTQENTHMHQ